MIEFAKKKMACKKNGVLLFLAIYFLIIVLAKMGLIATDPSQMNDTLSFSAPSLKYWFGNDLFGRSVLARGLHGGFTALTVGFMASTIATIIGSVLGGLAGYYGGVFDEVITGVFTVLESIPYILLLAGISFVVGQGLINVYVSLGLTSWVAICRLVRAECRKNKNCDYVLAARAIGFSDLAILFRHILPNMYSLIFTQFIIVFVFAIKSEVILTFLGLGVEPGSSSWGFMLDEARRELTNGFKWNFICVTLLMTSLVLALNSLVSKIQRDQ